MNRLKIHPLTLALTLILSAHAQAPAASAPSQRQVWTVLSCHGVSQTNLGDLTGDMRAKTQTSMDEMKIVRRGHSLEVKVNQIEVAAKLGKDLVSTDTFAITHETAEGLAATHGDSLYPTVHTLVIDSSGDYALWTESTLSWISASKNPTSTSVLFRCKR